MQVSWGQCTHIGQRSLNEDAVAVVPCGRGMLAVVADGSGNHPESGKVAVEQIVGQMRCRLVPGPNVEQTQKLLAALLGAHEAYLDWQLSLKRQPWATVVAALWPGGQKLYLAHLGDSRAYRLHEGRIEQLTVDDNVVETLLAAGTISRADLHRSPGSWRHLYRYLGCKDLDISGPRQPVRVLSISPNDRFLLCTDGLWALVPSEELQRVGREQTDPQTCADTLVQLALTNGCRDNVTCAVLDFAADKTAPLPWLGPGQASEPPVCRREWLRANDSCVAQVAQVMLSDGRFADMPLLGDALEDAGCTDTEILAHCREPGPHIGDCWVLALVSGML